MDKKDMNGGPVPLWVKIYLWFLVVIMPLWAAVQLLNYIYN